MIVKGGAALVAGLFTDDIELLADNERMLQRIVDEFCTVRKRKK